MHHLLQVSGYRGGGQERIEGILRGLHGAKHEQIPAAKKGTAPLSDTIVENNPHCNDLYLGIRE